MPNYEAVMDTIGVVTDSRGPCLEARKITVSTVGVIKRIAQFGHAFHGRVQLALSLHASTDETRRRIVPLAQRYPPAALFGRQFTDGSIMSVADTLGDGCEARETEVILAVPGRAQQFWSFDAHGRNVHHGHFPVRKGVEAVRFTPDACLGCHYEFDARRFNVMAPSFEALHLVLKRKDGEPQWTDHDYCATPRDIIVRHAAKVQNL